jgi:hypothetical protein
VTPEPAALAAVAAIPVGLALTGLTVARLVRLARAEPVARVPVAARHPVALPEAGPVELAIEGPRFTTRFRGLDYELVDAAGTPVPIGRVWMRTSSSGFSTSRLTIKRLDVPRPGTYELRIRGLVEGTDYTGCAIAFVRPMGIQILTTIPALLGAIGLTAGSIAVASALLLSGHTATDVASPTPPAPAPVSAVLEQHAGRSLAVDAGRLATAQEVVWPTLQMRLRVPADWVVQKNSTTDLDIRHPSEPSTYVLARVTPMPAGPSVSDYVMAHVAHAREQVDGDLAAGFATKPIGTVPGVVTLERRGGDSWLVVWTGFEPAQVGSLSVTVLLGAKDGDFRRDEGLLGAILDSIRFD